MADAFHSAGGYDTSERDALTGGSPYGHDHAVSGDDAMDHSKRNLVRHHNENIRHNPIYIVFTVSVLLLATALIVWVILTPGHYPRNKWYVTRIRGRHAYT